VQDIDFGDDGDKQGLFACAPGAVHQHRQAGVTDRPIPPGSQSPHWLRSHSRAAADFVLKSIIGQSLRREPAMRLLLATIAAAVAALSGEVVEFKGLPPVR
jgi:hypothetical protein